MSKLRPHTCYQICLIMILMSKTEAWQAYFGQHGKNITIFKDKIIFNLLFIFSRFFLLFLDSPNNLIL